MNQLDKFRFKNKISQLVRFSNRTGSHWNCFRYSSANTFEHEFRKFEVFITLRKKGIDVMTEVIFEKGGRADVLTSEGIIYEILHTETEEKFNEKLELYPKELEIRKIYTKDKWDEKLLY